MKNYFDIKKTKLQLLLELHQVLVGKLHKHTQAKVQN